MDCLQKKKCKCYTMENLPIYLENVTFSIFSTIREFCQKHENSNNEKSKFALTQ